MALDREVVVQFQPRADGGVVLGKTDARFPPVGFTLGATIPPDVPGGWGTYPRAAAQILGREFGIEYGIEGVVSSSLPIAAGLSASSALVVAAALAVLDADRLCVGSLWLMHLLARGERYVRVLGGGWTKR
jgi:galactokinase